MGRTRRLGWPPNFIRRSSKPSSYMAARRGTSLHLPWQGWRGSTYVRRIRWRENINQGREPTTSGPSQVGRCVRRMRDADDCAIYPQTTRHHCGVCSNMAYFGGVQGRRTAKRVDAKTVVVGATDELLSSRCNWIQHEKQIGRPAGTLRMGRELHAWLQTGHLVLSRQMGCETQRPDMPRGWGILVGGY